MQPAAAGCPIPHLGRTILVQHYFEVWSGLVVFVNRMALLVFDQMMIFRMVALSPIKIGKDGQGWVESRVSG